MVNFHNVSSDEEEKVGQYQMTYGSSSSAPSSLAVQQDLGHTLSLKECSFLNVDHASLPQRRHSDVPPYSCQYVIFPIFCTRKDADFGRLIQFLLILLFTPNLVSAKCIFLQWCRYPLCPYRRPLCFIAKRGFTFVSSHYGYLVEAVSPDGGTLEVYRDSSYFLANCAPPVQGSVTGEFLVKWSLVANCLFELKDSIFLPFQLAFHGSFDVFSLRRSFSLKSRHLSINFGKCFHARLSKEVLNNMLVWWISHRFAGAMLQGSYLLNKKLKSLKLSGDSRPPPSGEVSKFSLRRKLSRKKNPDFDVDKKSGKDQGKQSAAGASHYRRGSFLYRIDSDAELPHGATRHSDQHSAELTRPAKNSDGIMVPSGSNEPASMQDTPVDQPPCQQSSPSDEHVADHSSAPPAGTSTNEVAVLVGLDNLLSDDPCAPRLLFRRTCSTGALSKLDQANVKSLFWKKIPFVRSMVYTPFWTNGLHPVPSRAAQSSKLSSFPVAKLGMHLRQPAPEWLHKNGHGEDLIVTPFAQVLATLRNVRENIVALTQSADKASTSTTLRPSQVGPSSGPTEASSAVSSGTAAGGSMPDEATQHLAESTLMELDWCLEQLEAIQTHRSVSEMTSSKFRKMLTKELSQFSDSKSGDQLSRFIFSTFMGHDDDLELASEKQKQITDSIKESDEEKAFGASSKLGKTKQHVTSAMSHISGVHKLRKSPTTNAEETVAAALSDSTLMACTCTGSKFTPELENAIGEIDRWGMDVFKFHRLCDSHSLTTVTFTVMKNRGLIREFRINTTMLLTYLLHLEDHYRQNSYHNSIHATDVTQTVHVMFSAPSLNSVFTDLEKFAVIFAAAIHDVDHPGLTNQFLVNSGSELAIMYNDESVLEQHHLAVAFKLLQEPDCDILTGLSQKQRQLFRRIVIDTVLATDMSKHMSLLADLKTMVETKKLSGPGLPKLEKYGDRIQVLQNLIHIADLSNPSKPLPLYEQWVDRLLEEYWGQGDKEKELGFEVSPMCDRQNVSREKSQVGFIDYIVHPLMETWADLVYPDGQQILDQLEQNRNNFFVRLTEKDQEEFPVTT
ncbi:hypothetical protein M513_05286 [Trichuris suis]|uniref:Phosphodiesterase n=1 Tax=Trichuris suis TaxID=68888 RepID=A0A085M984_9BILA|nr:hypothetical protein M513_05286 [Trichuris suis]